MKIEQRQRRFWELVSEKEKLQEEIAPIRKAYDHERNADTGSKMRIAELKKQLLAFTPKLVELDEELTFLARGLRKAVGKRPDDLPPTAMAAAEYADDGASN